MKLSHKRILILFSVALNVGFVIMAVVMMIHHPTSFHNRSKRAMLGIVQQLNLPEDREQTVLAAIQDFRTTIDQHEAALKQARGDIVRYLSRKGPVDKQQLHGLIETAEIQEKQKSRAFEAHVIDLRKQLGDEQGAQFFSLLLAHIEAEDKTPHR